MSGGSCAVYSLIAPSADRGPHTSPRGMRQAPSRGARGATFLRNDSLAVVDPGGVPRGARSRRAWAPLQSARITGASTLLVRQRGATWNAFVHLTRRELVGRCQPRLSGRDIFAPAASHLMPQGGAGARC
jgi:hypothetical protein